MRDKMCHALVTVFAIGVAIGHEMIADTNCFFDDRMDALRCRGSDLAAIRSAVGQKLGQIAVLDINFCEVPEIAEPLFVAPDSSDPDLTSTDLRSVSIVNSGLEVIAEDAFAGVGGQLEELDLSGNLLADLPTAVLNLTRLVTLDLSRNRIGKLPHGSAFNSLNTLVRLDLSENRLGAKSTNKAPYSLLVTRRISHSLAD